jgi:hypothetical protein
MGHVVVGRANGLKLASMRIRLYYHFILAVAVQIPGVFFLPKRKRIALSLAGPIMNLFLANTAFILSSVVGANTIPGVSLQFLAASNYMVVLGNLLPFLPTDGYQCLSLLLFKNIDIRLSLTTKLRNGAKLRTFDCFHLGYLVLYIVSNILILVVLNIFLVRFFSALVFFHLPPLIHHLLSGICIIAANFFITRKMYRFFKPKGQTT